MYKDIEKWIDNVDLDHVPEEVKGFCFNLYEDKGNVWSMEIVGTEWFDADDEDWRCDEVTTFDTRDTPFEITRDCGWEEVLEEYVDALKKYLENGKYADVLKSREGVGTGFVDGDAEVLFSKTLNL